MLRSGSGFLGVVLLTAGLAWVILRGGDLGALTPGAALGLCLVLVTGLGLRRRATRPARAQASAAPARRGPPPVAVVPQILPPGEDTTSWIGGIPSLTPGTGWPVIEGAPAVFLAQIALADLPRRSWGRLARHRGSLAFFINARDPGLMRVISVGAGARPQDPPEPPDPCAYRAPGDISEVYDRATGMRPQGFLRWPVRFALRTGGGGARRGSALAPSVAGADLSGLGAQPFDWPSCFCLIDAVRRDLQLRLASRADPAGRRVLMLVLDRLNALHGELARAAALAPFEPGLRDLCLRGLAALEPGRDGIGMEGGFGPYFELLDFHARLVFCTRPAHLPAAHRALFQPLWEDLGAREWAGTGGRDARSGAMTTLFRLPSNTLSGMYFGPGQRLAVQLPTEDLPYWDFTRIRGVLEKDG